MQRVLTVAADMRTHATCHQAVIGPIERRLPERQLHEVLQAQDVRQAVLFAQVTASLLLELAVPTLTGR